MLTLAHELAHIWLGGTALSDATVASRQQNAVETWCNRVAAEVLAPLDVVRAELRRGEQLGATLRRLGRRFKVSTSVVLQQLRDAQHMTWDEFDRAYGEEVQRLEGLPKREGGCAASSQHQCLTLSLHSSLGSSCPALRRGPRQHTWPTWPWCEQL